MSRPDIVLMRFGSHLYGTDLPSSDLDYKGVSFPAWRDLALGRPLRQITHTCTKVGEGKNAASDTDVEIFALHEFIDLALEGQTVAFDMLHAPEDMLILTSEVWEDIVRYRHKFYSRSTNAFIGYARKQAAKYGIKGSRLAALREALLWAEGLGSGTSRLKDHDITTFPAGEHSTVIHPNLPEQEAKHLSPLIEVCGKKMHVTSTVDEFKRMLSAMIDRYGERARMAEANSGIDWKAMSHAYRAACQVEELFTAGTITFPRPERDLLKRIKQGVMPFREVQELLEDSIDRVLKLREVSALPDTPDRLFWEEFIIEAVREHVLPGKMSPETSGYIKAHRNNT